MARVKAEHEAEVKKLHANILDIFIQPSSLEEMLNLELSDKGESPLESMKNNNSSVEQIGSMNNLFQKLQVEK